MIRGSEPCDRVVSLRPQHLRAAWPLGLSALLKESLTGENKLLSSWSQEEAPGMFPLFFSCVILEMGNFFGKSQVEIILGFVGLKVSVATI